MSGYSNDMDWSAGILPGTTQQADPWAAGVAGSTGFGLGTGTGQHGTQTVTATSSANPFVKAWQWINEPFTTPMSPVSIVLLVGVVLVAIVAWNLVLYHIRIAAETI